ncbi:unnamed protein product [Phaedon cochleariae]|uniref:Uncharacterized protein n=1 Tax=Phaedon cochleariae TaxID=80249 RepID=A0A9N9WZ19_PHACE|nr:unnamed protein product [Phaedon cochleariae]
MVRTLLLGLLVATICGIAVGSPAAGSVPEGQPFRPDPGQERQEEEDDPGARSERSTNLTGIEAPNATMITPAGLPTYTTVFNTRPYFASFKTNSLPMDCSYS